jgi:hypothetical protein
MRATPRQTWNRQLLASLEVDKIAIARLFCERPDLPSNARWMR